MFFRDPPGAGGSSLFTVDITGYNELREPTPGYASDPAGRRCAPEMPRAGTNCCRRATYGRGLPRRSRPRHDPAMGHLQ